MGMMPQNWYREEARKRQEPGKLEVDTDATVSSGVSQPPERRGAWVQAWLWVPDPLPPETKT